MALKHMPSDLLAHCAHCEILLAEVFERGLVIKTEAVIDSLRCYLQYSKKLS